MKSKIAVLAVATLLAGCQSAPRPDAPVDEVYVHRYGVTLPQEDWESRGQCGKVVSTLKDGVVVSRNYEAGVLEGETTYSFPHSETVAKKEVYSQGYLTQEMQNYPSGLPRQKTTYDSDTGHDKTVLSWYESSAPQGQETYKNDLLIEAEYFLPSGQTEAKVENGKGFRTHRDQIGQLASKDTIADGAWVACTEFFPNGTPKAINEVSNGTIHGKVSTFLIGGEPNTVEQWSNGKQQGTTIVFQNGGKFAEVPYNKGIKSGIEKRFKNQNQVIEEITWKNGMKHGPARTYVNGETKTRWYFEDREVTQSGYELLSRPMP